MRGSRLCIIMKKHLIYEKTLDSREARLIFISDYFDRRGARLFLPFYNPLQSDYYVLRSQLSMSSQSKRVGSDAVSLG